MGHFLQRIGDFLNSGNEEVRTWFLVRNNYLPLILCAFYAIFSTIIGPAFMKNRKPFNLRKTMIVFNFFLVSMYLGMLSVALWNFRKIKWETFCHGKRHIVKGETEYTLAVCAWVFYLVKYLEFFDTLFFVLRKKQNLITFLHVVHHTLVPLISWVFLRTETNGSQVFLPILNSVVHVIMYTYYGMAAMGPKYRKYLWWKKYLTQLQMAQFILFVAFAVIVAPLSGCAMRMSGYIVDILVGFLFLYLFYNYYSNSFQSKQKAAATNGHPHKNGFKPE